MTRQAAHRTPVQTAAKPTAKATGANTVIELEREARRADTTRGLAFTAVNHTHRLLPYFQCLLWRRNKTGDVVLYLVSGVSEIDPHAPFARFCRRVIKNLLQQPDFADINRFSPQCLPRGLNNEWQEWLPEHALWCPFSQPSTAASAGLLLIREHPFEDTEIELLTPLVEAYGHAWYALTRARRPRYWQRTLGSRVFRWGLVALVVAALALPVRESALAPSEIVPLDPQLVTAPLRGVIKTIEVAPNVAVQPQQLLLTLDDAEIRTRVAVAEKNLEVVEAEYLRAAQKSFSDAQAKSDLALFKARVAEKRLERDHARRLLSRTQVRASVAGIAVFDDPNDWIGRPVEVGERIMTLADPRQVGVQIWLPLADSIQLERNTPVRLFLNSDPLQPVDARVRQTSYEPMTDPTGALAFRLKAELESQTQPPRIGLKGTAKVYGREVSLFYYLMRRPIAALRQSLGW